MRQECDLDLEKNLKEALTLECAGLTASRDLKERIDEEIRKEAAMKRFSVKKIVIGVAVGCLLISGGVLAAGHATSLVTHNFLPDAYRSYSDMGKAQEELGYAVDSVEAFSNGYRFDLMFVNDWQGQDEGGNKLYTYKSLDITYDKKGAEDINLTAEKPVETPVRDKEPNAVRTIGNITVYYDTITYKFVPPNYQLTDEDRANDARPDYTISVGSDEVYTKQACHVTWEKDGIQYALYGFDLGLSAEELFDMAEEVITAE